MYRLLADWTVFPLRFVVMDARTYRGSMPLNSCTDQLSAHIQGLWHGMCSERKGEGKLMILEDVSSRSEASGGGANTYRVALLIDPQTGHGGSVTWETKGNYSTKCGLCSCRLLGLPYAKPT